VKIDAKLFRVVMDELKVALQLWQKSITRVWNLTISTT